MCGGCGTARHDWAQGLVGGRYASTVVARTLTAVLAGAAVSVTPAGWNLAPRGRLATPHPTLDSLVESAAHFVPRDLAAEGRGWDVWHEVLAGMPVHRPVDTDRRATPQRYRGGEGDCAATGGEPGERASPWVLGAPDPQRTISRVTLFALARRATGHPGRLRLADDRGEWSLRLPTP
jgi:hypothetical protein